ncbi:MAG TPA: globin domain-containing protein [Acidimicrobiales bacterium]|nr:globin domain-containing protein [Acidimicrobiales bacterium]
MVDIGRLKESWRLVAGHGDQVPLRFYSRLFVAHPEVRDMFALSMATQRDRFFVALGHTVSQVDDLEALTPFLQQLGRDHRKFGMVPEHFGPVGEALLATLADFMGEGWTLQLSDDWTTAYKLVASVMIDAAEEAGRTTPPWWEAEVVAHEHRTFDIAVLTLLPEPAYDYVAGQSVPVETELRPRVWRHYSPANAPRADGTVDLHVRRVPGGQVSSALVDSIRVGDRLRLGAPRGQRLTLDGAGGLGAGGAGGPAPGGIVLIAGGTGLAPLKALVEQLGADPAPAAGAHPPVTLLVGAATARELYDLDSLVDLGRRHPWLTVVPAVADPEDPLHDHEQGTAVEVALRLGSWPEHDIYLCGSDEMVATSIHQLRQAGCAIERMRWEGFHGLAGEAYGVIDLEEDSPR